MKLNLGDVIPTSTLDWPGKVVLVVFMWGCPLKCPYCSNSRFIEVPEDIQASDTETVNARVLEASRFVDGVIFSGGEPFMQPAALREMAEYVKGLGLLVGVHTNGAYPDRIEEMANADLLDAVFMDVKAPLEYEPYRAACGDMDRSLFEAIRRSLALCCELRRKGKIQLMEARTTVFQGISDRPDDIAKIALEAECADAYVVQQGRPEVAMDDRLKSSEAVHRNKLVELARAAREKSSVKVVKVRTHLYGDEIIKA
ncbi:putative anaerobic ribonucleoside-triphosphate reductase-activating protein [Methanocella paludicola SANAE]|uniref:Anaerobic ribonucleoside-triphosphate reductase-activating protein n=1 Tax=Methanocella paludicola (strain DSM 17711 / JCM 13418 / NBRC 101707 / SANAE) TaxID=304371 RepID=D1Z2H9_METPS|nr:anaerobic ribonucleoside-triphosphate reductase activating protein [Methanocella paludicola]BAI62901.1 putative anaerobic ribonucleoside-triphosphate reductase-activating protein [Methanocella paludicola SANAE]